MLSWLRRIVGGGTRARLLAGAAYTAEEVALGGQRVLVRALTAAEQLEYNQRLREASADGKTIPDDVALTLTATVVARVCVDNKGQRIFHDDDVQALAETLSFEQLRAVLTTSVQLSGATQEQIELAAADVKKAKSSASRTG